MSAFESNVGETSTDVDDRSDATPDLEYARVENGHGETEVTFYPRACDDAEIVTRWITVPAESVVSLDRMR